MGIGTSLGTYHDDEMSYQSNQFFSPDPDQPGVLKPSWQTDKKGEQDAQEFQDMKTDLPTKPMPIADKSSGPTLGASYSAMMSRVLNDPDFQQVGDFGPVPIRTPEQAAAAVRSQTSNIGPDTGTRFNPTDRALEVIDRALNEGGLTAQARAGRPPARRESGQGAADAEMRIRPSKQGPERKSIEQLIDEWNAGPDSSP